MSKPEPGVIASLNLFGLTPMTRHGALRSRQRSIPRQVIELLLDFGQEEPAGGGCYRYFFTKRAWHIFSRRLGSQTKCFERYRSAYLVVGDDGHIVTVGWIH